MTTKEKANAAKWIGDGPAPIPHQRRITVVYQLTEEGQREAFLTTFPQINSIYGSAMECNQVCTRQLRYDESDDYRDAFRLAHIEKNGGAYVCIGGVAAFIWDGDKLMANPTVPGKWEVTLESVGKKWEGNSYDGYHRDIEQVIVDSLAFDDPTTSTHNLLDAENLRRFEIKQSKSTATAQLEKEEEEELEAAKVMLADRNLRNKYVSLPAAFPYKGSNTRGNT